MAAPVDTFVPTRGGENLARLAQGLSALEPALQRYTAIAAQQDKEENLERGSQKARELAEQRITFREAVKQGLIDPHENPWFVRGAKVQMGRAAAGKYGSDLMETMLTDRELQESGDLAAFDAKEAEFRKKWIEENVGKADGTFAEGFGQIADGYTLDARRSFAAAAGARMEKTAGENHYTIVGQALEEASTSGNFATALQIINAETADYLRDNPRAGRIANLRTVQAVEDWARLHYKEVTQESLTDLLKQIDAGPGAKLFGTKEAKEMIARASNQAVQLRQQENQVEDYRINKERREAERTMYSDLSKTFLEASDPTKVDIAPFLQRAVMADPVNGAKAIHEFRQMFVEAKDEGDPVVFENALLRVFGANPEQPGLLTMGQVAGMRGSLSRQQIGTLLNEIDQRNQRSASGTDPVQKFLDNNIVQSARSSLMKEMGYDDFGSNDPEIKARSGLAYNAFQTEVIQRWQEFSKLTPKALNGELTDMVERIFKQHATEEMLSLQRETQEGVKKTVDAATKGEFKDAIGKITPADQVAMDALRSTMDKLRTPKGRQAFAGFDEPTKRFLFRLGVPPNIEKIGQFFTELDRTSRE